jgi:hypothetical protein
VGIVAPFHQIIDGSILIEGNISSFHITRSRTSIIFNSAKLPENRKQIPTSIPIYFNSVMSKMLNGKHVESEAIEQILILGNNGVHYTLISNVESNFHRCKC